MNELDNIQIAGMEALDDDMLDNVSGGSVNIGDVVHVNTHRVNYCPSCGKLSMEYDATITGIRGVLDGSTVYWITRSCCGYRSSAIDSSFEF